MVKEIHTIECPNCKHKINLDDLLFHQIDSETKGKIRNGIENEYELKLAERNSVIEKLREQTLDMTRRLSQGSMQLQGEVQELAIEDYIKTNIPSDHVKPIGKGAKGGDTIQIVNSPNRQNCGSIYYESKRTKDFQPSWIEKFKEDIRMKNATIGVIVTSAMPKGMERFGVISGIWICSYNEFKILCFALREAIIMHSEAMVKLENRTEAVGTLLYDYITSNEFKMYVEAIVESCSQMRADLESERRSMEMLLKKREKQIQKLLLNTTHMIGSLNGISANKIVKISALELDGAETIA